MSRISRRPVMQFTPLLKIAASFVFALFIGIAGCKYILPSDSIAGASISFAENIGTQRTQTFSKEVLKKYGTGLGAGTVSGGSKGV